MSLFKLIFVGLLIWIVLGLIVTCAFFLMTRSKGDEADNSQVNATASPADDPDGARNSR